jgi:hypothetical protein
MGRGGTIRGNLGRVTAIGAKMAFASECREPVPLNPMVPTVERRSVIGGPGFVDDARAVFGNRTTI